MLKAIVFDAYGTLFDTKNGSVNAAGKILESRGRGDISALTFYARWKQIHKMHMDADGGFITEEQIYHLDLKRLYAEYKIDGDADTDVEIMLSLQGTRDTFPETAEAVKTLRRNYTVCIGSTTDTKPLMTDIERSGITFDGVFTSEMMKCYKPHPKFYLTILESLKLSPHEVLFVGDTPENDVEGPQRVGMKTCLIDRKGICHSSCPDYTVSDLRELFDIVGVSADTPAFT